MRLLDLLAATSVLPGSSRVDQFCGLAQLPSPVWFQKKVVHAPGAADTTGDGTATMAVAVIAVATAATAVLSAGRTRAAKGVHDMGGLLTRTEPGSEPGRGP
jgi:hypothetical protein